MTRDEAYKIAYDDFGAGTRGLVNALAKLGVLPLDEPEGSEDTRHKAIGAFFSIRGPVTSRALFEALDKAGLKIVEK